MAGDTKGVVGIDMQHPSHTPMKGSTMPVDRAATDSLDISVLSRENTMTLLDLDMSSLDPNFKYRWVNATATKFQRAKLKGYVPVEPSKEEIKTTVGTEPDISPDGLYRVADVVLMKIPRAGYKRRRLLVRKKTEDRLTSVAKKAKGRLRKVKRDVQIIDEEE